MFLDVRTLHCRRRGLPGRRGVIGSHDDVVVTLDVADSTATLSSNISGTSSIDGSIVRWTPGYALEPSSVVVVTLRTCGQDEVVDYAFDVEAGDPIGGGSKVDGNGWEVEMPSLFTALGLSEFQLTATGGSSKEIEFSTIGAVCLPLPTADFEEDPCFDVCPSDTTLQFDDEDIPVSNFHLSGTLVEGGTRMIGVEIGFVLDVRAVAADDMSAEDICDGLAIFNQTCGPCGDGEAYCADLNQSDLTGEPLGGDAWCN